MIFSPGGIWYGSACNRAVHSLKPQTEKGNHFWFLKDIRAHFLGWQKSQKCCKVSKNTYHELEGKKIAQNIKKGVNYKKMPFCGIYRGICLLTIIFFRSGLYLFLISISSFSRIVVTQYEMSCNRTFTSHTYAHREYRVCLNVWQRSTVAPFISLSLSLLATVIHCGTLCIKLPSSFSNIFDVEANQSDL